MNKPKIEKLFDANMAFGVRNQKAGFTISKWIESRELYKEDLIKLGIADMFDWTGDDDAETSNTKEGR